MKKKIKKLLDQVSNIDGNFLTYIKIHSDESGKVYNLENILFNFSNLKELKKGLKKIIKEQSK